MQKRKLLYQLNPGANSSGGFQKQGDKMTCSHDAFLTGENKNIQTRSTRSIHRYAYGLAVAGLFFLVGFNNNSSAQQKAVYNMFLEEPIPANGTEVFFNAPVLRWPFQKGKRATYDVQLSPSSTFEKSATLTAEKLSGAIYNPHQALATGNWYWRYKVTGKDWSAVYHFRVTDKALSMVSPTADKFLASVPNEHPRILANGKADKLTALINTPDARTILSEADQELSKGIYTEADAQPAVKGFNAGQDKKILSDAIVALGNQVYKMVLPLCQAYLLTGKIVYRDKAIAMGMEVAKWDPEGVSGSRDFTDGMCMYNMALVFDTFYDDLSAIQRQTLQKAITLRLSKFYNSWVNNIESKVLSGHVWQLILNEFFKSALALYGHEAAAGAWLSYGYELFLGRAPVLGGADGGWGEGASYFQMNMETLVEIPAFIKQYTGFDFMKAHPWYQQQADWLIYHFPPLSSADGYGDNTEDLFEPPPSYASFAIVMAKLMQNGKYAWYAEQLIKQQQPDLTKELVLRWFRMKYTSHLSMPAAANPQYFPMGYISKETGIAALHTNTANTKNDVMVTMRSSPFGAYGHILADQNTFNILAGGKRLFYRTGYKVAMDDPHRLKWSKHTRSMNGILINGEGQPYSVESNGYFSRFLQGGELAYMKGNAANAYQSKETKEDYGVSKFDRHTVLLKPGIIVIYDELKAESEVSWSWLIHSLKNMKLDTMHNSFTATIEDWKGVGRLWSSDPFTWNITDTFAVPAVVYRNYTGMKTKKYENTQWHLKATNRQKKKQLRFLAIIQVDKNGAVIGFKEATTGKGITKITVGDWEIEAALSSDLAPHLQIQSMARKVAFTAYGEELGFQGNTYKGNTANSSKLIELVNGKIIFTETGDQLLPPIR